MKKSELIFSAILVPVDYLMIVLAAVVAYGLRFTGFVAEIRPIVFTLPFSDYLLLVSLIALGWLVIFALSKLYTITGQKRLIDEISRIFLACSTSIAGVIIFIFFRRELFSSRFIIVAIWLFSFIFVSLGRIIVRKIQRSFYERGYGNYKVIIIGKDNISNLILTELQSDKRLGYEVVRQVTGFNEKVEEIFDDYKKENNLDLVIVADLNMDRKESARLINYCSENHIGFKYATDVFKIASKNIEIGVIAGIPIIEIKNTKLDGWGKIWKRLFDLFVSLILIILLLPFWIIMSLIIKFDSKGPIFFSYQRVGEYGKLFKYYKFRSMIDKAHEKKFDPEFLKKVEDERKNSPMTKFKNDPRITRVGKFIRKYSLDELPELFNVFVGKMSLVGPRPHEIEEVAKYAKHHKKVLAIKPGITGLAQISGRSDLDFEDEVNLDTFYIENWSMRMDLWILFKTPFALLKKRKTL
jgi:exopolysaccharide biosynthesis polyprenyl glycosylphosphotransferase